MAIGFKPLFDVQNSVAQGFSYTSYTDFNNISSGEQDFFLMKNPAGSGKRLMITHLSFGVDSSSARSIIKVYSDPTITIDGTAIPVVNTYIRDSNPSSVVSCFKLPTISARGSALNLQILPANQPSRGLNRFYLVDPGHDILVTINNSIGNAATFAEAYWLEVN